MKDAFALGEDITSSILCQMGLDLLVQRVSQAKVNKELAFNYQMGRRWISTSMVITILVHLNHIGALRIKEALCFGHFDSKATLRRATQSLLEMASTDDVGTSFTDKHFCHLSSLTMSALASDIKPSPTMVCTIGHRQTSDPPPLISDSRQELAHNH
eukprot:Gb_14598 [translate_table: standard]